MSTSSLPSLGAYSVLCAQTIALLVYLNSVQPFVLSQIFGLEQNGSASGVLALVDETVSIVAAPFWGALSDKVGTRYVAFIGQLLMAVSLSIYPKAPSLYPGLLLYRAVFSLGAAACVSMITAILGELSLLQGASPSPSRAGSPESNGDQFSHEDGDRTVPLFEAPAIDEVYDSLVFTSKPNGKLAGLAGFSYGIGAVLSVSLLLPLPTQLGDGSEGLTRAFSWVSIETLAVSVILLVALYQNPTKGWRALFGGNADVSIFDEAAVDAGGTVMSYLELLQDGFLAARTDSRLKLAYLGSLVARSASVIIALFVPLWTNNWYYEHGKCTFKDPQGCRDAVIQAAILTGFANLVTLLAAPIVGWAGDRYGSITVLGFSALAGIISMVGFFLVGTVIGVVPILICCVFGFAQIGVMTMSLSMTTDQRRVAGGSVAGVSAFCGSVGILVITQIGGPLSDIWIKSPFVVMTILFAVLGIGAHQLSSRTTLRSVRSSVSLR